jgi:hypothetical protein
MCFEENNGDKAAIERSAEVPVSGDKATTEHSFQVPVSAPVSSPPLFIRIRREPASSPESCTESRVTSQRTAENVRATSTNCVSFEINADLPTPRDSLTSPATASVSADPPTPHTPFSFSPIACATTGAKSDSSPDLGRRRVKTSLHRNSESSGNTASIEPSPSIPQDPRFTPALKSISDAWYAENADSIRAFIPIVKQEALQVAVIHTLASRCFIFFISQT